MSEEWSATLKPNIQFLLIHTGKKDQVVQLGGDAFPAAVIEETRADQKSFVTESIQNLLCASLLPTDMK